MNIYVSNLSRNTTDESLKELFGEYGETISAKVIVDKLTGFPRGFGFVEMTNENDGRNAIEGLSESEFEGNIIRVNVAHPRTERNTGGQYNRGGGGFNRNRY